MIKHVEKPKEYTRRRSNPPIVKPAAPPRTTPLREDPVLPDAPVASILKKPVAMLDNRPTKLENSPDKTRYSDAELNEFRELIIQKLTDAKVELNNLQAFLNNSNEHGTDDTASSFKMLEDGSDTLAKEEAGQLAARQRKFIEQLENALVRIENKTYGLCRVTGKLIPKERLRAVPHTTQSIEAKVQQYRN
ncbi:MAG TPA: TraR/DksA C4-type zinc finger protein [Bacteroidia bacterium]|nr:TraR/DksA C4-type zinc finger protein [Bacteroidia bacterium]HMU19273.1 TraR/DksA C4-type zinc finger protein [Bacteroidia bacterium]